jgi:hypothetical protein
MLKSIAKPSPDLQAFIQSLNLPLNQAQEQHITQMADALVTIDGRKTLSALYRAITGNPSKRQPIPFALPPGKLITSVFHCARS